MLIVAARASCLSPGSLMSQNSRRPSVATERLRIPSKSRLLASAAKSRPSAAGQSQEFEDGTRAELERPFLPKAVIRVTIRKRRLCPNPRAVAGPLGNVKRYEPMIEVGAAKTGREWPGLSHCSKTVLNHYQSAAARRLLSHQPRRFYPVIRNLVKSMKLVGSDP